MGYYHDEPVLIIKTSQGNRSIGWDFLPPGSEQYIYGDYTYAGYGDSPNRWLTGTTPEPIDWYAGKQYDDCVVAAHDVLNNFATNFPQWQEQGYEIAGFGWWQGHKDQYDASYADRYELNLANLINALRAEFNAPDAPFVVATIGFNGGPYAPDSAYGKIHAAQMAVSDPAKHPEFAGNVMTMDTLGYWRTVEESPVSQDYHYNRNAETFMLVGDAMGRAMVELKSGGPSAPDVDFSGDGKVNFEDYSIFAQYFSGNEPSVDLAPPFGDGIVDSKDLGVFVEYWLTATTIPPLPEQAGNPNPSDGATDVSLTAILSWTTGSGATSHDVYFGRTNPPPFIGNQTATTLEPGQLTTGTKFHWRIDEVNGWGKTTGQVWNFTTTTDIPPPPPPP
jgi:hypothetical protein